jgi:hypothetical protein
MTADMIVDTSRYGERKYAQHKTVFEVRRRGNKRVWRSEKEIIIYARCACGIYTVQSTGIITGR